MNPMLIPALISAGSGLFSLFRGDGKSDQQKRTEQQAQTNMGQLQQMQMNRIRQSDPLYQAIMRMAIGLMPQGAQMPMQPPVQPFSPQNPGPRAGQARMPQGPR